MKKLKRTLFSILFMALLLCTSTMQTFAMETGFRLPVEIVVEGDRPVEPETFVVRMKPLTKGAPMPEHTQDEQAVIEIQGQGTKEFSSMKFTQPGVYQYEITQQAGKARYYTYDKCVYNVTVYCTAGSSKNLETTVVALEQGKEEVKKDAVRFTNGYELPKTSAEQKEPSSEQRKPVKTGDNTPVQVLLCTFVVSGLVILLLYYKKAQR